MTKPKQLTFPWSRKFSSQIDNYYFDINNESLKNSLFETNDLIISGSNAVGKTFILQAICNFYTQKNKTSLYIPLKDVSNLGAEILDSLENIHLICFDDIDQIQKDRQWEVAIFNLVNACLISGSRIILSTKYRIHELQFNLLDLESRIKKFEYCELKHVEDKNLKNALLFISNKRSITLGPKEIDYLLTYTKRSLKSLIDILDQLDELSMQLKRRITIPLIKKII